MPHLESCRVPSAIELGLWEEERSDLRGLDDGVDDYPQYPIHRGQTQPEHHGDIQVRSTRQDTQGHR